MRRVYVDCPRVHIRRNNTDWECMQFLRQLPAFGCAAHYYFPDSLIHAARANARYVRKVIAARLRGRWGGGESLVHKWDGPAPHDLACMAVYAHGDFPMGCCAPVIWRNTILDPAMQRYAGVSEQQLAHEADVKRELFAQATFVHVSTRAEAARLSAQFPEFQHRFAYIPFFLPYLDAVPLEEVVARHSTRPIRISFVGRHARRKGLDLLLDAFKAAGFVNRDDIRLMVVSDISDGGIETPQWRNVAYIRSLSRSDALELIRSSHVFVMPSRFESYGLTYIEAMAMGAVPVVPDWEVQREIVASGAAGVITPLRVDALAERLRVLVSDHDSRLQLAIRARKRFVDEYEAHRVAPLFDELVKLACRLAAPQS